MNFMFMNCVFESQFKITFGLQARFKALLNIFYPDLPIVVFPFHFPLCVMWICMCARYVLCACACMQRCLHTCTGSAVQTEAQGWYWNHVPFSPLTEAGSVNQTQSFPMPGSAASAFPGCNWRQAATPSWCGHFSGLKC